MNLKQAKALRKIAREQVPDPEIRYMSKRLSPHSPHESVALDPSCQKGRYRMLKNFFLEVGGELARMWNQLC